MKKILVFIAVSLMSAMVLSCGTKIDHSTPSSIVKSCLEAINNGDVNGFLECLELSNYEGEKLEKLKAKAEKYVNDKKGNYKSFSVDESTTSGDWVEYEYTNENGSTGHGALGVDSYEGAWYVTVHSTGVMYHK